MTVLFTRFGYTTMYHSRSLLWTSFKGSSTKYIEINDTLLGDNQLWWSELKLDPRYGKYIPVVSLFQSSFTPAHDKKVGQSKNRLFVKCCINTESLQKFDILTSKTSSSMILLLTLDYICWCCCLDSIRDESRCTLLNILRTHTLPSQSDTDLSL